MSHPIFPAQRAGHWAVQFVLGALRCTGMGCELSDPSLAAASIRATRPAI
jgi:hypothetical protein